MHNTDCGVVGVRRTGDDMTDLTDIRTGTFVVDEFLEKHGAVLPAHIIDFALDVRSIFIQMEERDAVGV